ncbi:MAG: hypothetical protein PHR87_07360 [Sulfurospirillaceae bacterium]|nr:hypothetical protein [Sulfurospirillaceae bacterium]
MKKFLIYAVSFVLILSAALFGLLFTSAGNAIVKPILESKIAQATQKPVSLDTFSLGISHLSFSATIDKTSFVKLNGTYNILGKSFDVTFDTSLENIAFDAISITSKMSLKGTAKGDINTIHIIANGKALQGTIAIDANVLDQKSLKDTTLTLEHVEVKELLSLLSQPLYAQGLIDLNANLKNVTPSAVDGLVDFKLHPTALNTEAFTQTLGIDLPQNTTAQANMHALLKGQTITSSLNILSTLSNLKMQKMLYNVSSQTFHSDYAITIHDFSKLEPLTKVLLKGQASMNGEINYSPKGYDATLNSDIMESDTKAHIINDSLIASITNLKLDALMNFLNKPSYTQGDLTLEAKLDSLKALKGTITQHISNGRVNTTLVNKDFNQTLPQSLTYSMQTDAIIDDHLIKATSLLDTSIANISLKNFVYDLKKLDLISEYHVNISDLSKLKDIAQRDLQGKVILDGHIKQSKEALMMDGISSLFGGKFSFKLDNNMFKAALDDAQLSELLSMLTYPDFFTSTIAATIDYDLTNDKGSLKATSNDGRFKQNQLGVLLLAVTGLDITNEIYNTIVFDANILKEIIHFKANMVSQHTHIKTDNGMINQATKDIASKIDIQIRDKNYTAKLSGKTDNPKIKMDTGALLKGLLGESVSDGNKTAKEKAPIQNLLKGLKF